MMQPPAARRKPCTNRARTSPATEGENRNGSSDVDDQRSSNVIHTQHSEVSSGTQGKGDYSTSDSSSVVKNATGTTTVSSSTSHEAASGTTFNSSSSKSNADTVDSSVIEIKNSSSSQDNRNGDYQRSADSTSGTNANSSSQSYSETGKTSFKNESSREQTTHTPSLGLDLVRTTTATSNSSGKGIYSVSSSQSSQSSGSESHQSASQASSESGKSTSFNSNDVTADRNGTSNYMGIVVKEHSYQGNSSNATTIYSTSANTTVTDGVTTTASNQSESTSGTTTDSANSSASSDVSYNDTTNSGKNVRVTESSKSSSSSGATDSFSSDSASSSAMTTNGTTVSTASSSSSTGSHDELTSDWTSQSRDSKTIVFLDNSGSTEKSWTIDTDTGHSFDTKADSRTTATSNGGTTIYGGSGSADSTGHGTTFHSESTTVNGKLPILTQILALVPIPGFDLGGLIDTKATNVTYRYEAHLLDTVDANNQVTTTGSAASHVDTQDNHKIGSSSLEVGLMYAGSGTVTEVEKTANLFTGTHTIDGANGSETTAEQHQTFVTCGVDWNKKTTTTTDFSGTYYNQPGTVHTHSTTVEEEGGSETHETTALLPFAPGVSAMLSMFGSSIVATNETIDKIEHHDSSRGNTITTITNGDSVDNIHSHSTSSESDTTQTHYKTVFGSTLDHSLEHTESSDSNSSYDEHLTSNSGSRNRHEQSTSHSAQTRHLFAQDGSYDSSKYDATSHFDETTTSSYSGGMGSYTYTNSTRHRVESDSDDHSSQKTNLYENGTSFLVEQTGNGFNNSTDTTDSSYKSSSGGGRSHSQTIDKSEWTTTFASPAVTTVRNWSHEVIGQSSGSDDTDAKTNGSDTQVTLVSQGSWQPQSYRGRFNLELSPIVVQIQHTVLTAAVSAYTGLAAIDSAAGIAWDVFSTVATTMGNGIDWLFFQETAQGSAYSNNFYALVGDYILRPYVGDKRLARPGNSFDDLMIATRLAASITVQVDRTGISKLLLTATGSYEAAMNLANGDTSGLRSLAENLGPMAAGLAANKLLGLNACNVSTMINRLYQGGAAANEGMNAYTAFADGRYGDGLGHLFNATLHVLDAFGSFCFTAGHQVLVLDAELAQRIQFAGTVAPSSAAGQGDHTLVLAVGALTLGVAGRSWARHRARRREEEEQAAAVDEAFRMLTSDDDANDTALPAKACFKSNDRMNEDLMKGESSVTSDPASNEGLLLSGAPILPGAPARTACPGRRLPSMPRRRSSATMRHVGRIWFLLCVALAACTWGGWKSLSEVGLSQPAQAGITPHASVSGPAMPGVEWIAGLPYRWQNIETVRPDQQVLASEPESGRLGPKPVLHAFVRHADHLRLLTIEDADGNRQTHETTDEHPYWSVTRQDWVLARELQAGEELRTSNGTRVHVLASHREEHPGTKTVYNFEVDDWHSYYVRPPEKLRMENAASEAVLVHNANKKKYVNDDGSNPAATNKQTLKNLLTAAEQAEFKALQAAHPDWMPKKGLSAPATIRSVAENAEARAEFTGRGHHPHPLKFGGDPNPPDLVVTGETRTIKNPIHTKITNWWNKVLSRLLSDQ